ncbi:MAG: 30S ribosomal protein S20 [Bacteriovoracia bacterium]
MANKKSAQKRARQNLRRRARNLIVRSNTKTETRKAELAIQGAKSEQEAKAALLAGEKVLRKAASKGIIPKERASRKVSRLATMLNKKFSKASEKSARA